MTIRAILSGMRLASLIACGSRTNASLGSLALLLLALPLLAVSAAVCPAAANRPPAATGLDQPVLATWTRLPLLEWTRRVADLSGRPIVLDRRIDPSQPVTLTARGETVRELLARVAADAGGAVEELGTTVRIVPAAVAGQATRAERDREIRLGSLPAGGRAKALARKPWRWPTAARPQDLVASALAEAGLEIAGIETIPHDHFPAAELPALPLADRLDLILAHFDRRILWKSGADGTAGRIVAIDDQITPAADRQAAARPGRPRGGGRPPRRPRPAPRDSFSLRLEAPLDQALAAITRQLGLKLALDTASLTARGIAPAEIVRVEVKDATRADLFDAVVRPLSLEWTLEADTLRVFATEPSAGGNDQTEDSP